MDYIGRLVSHVVPLFNPKSGMPMAGTGGPMAGRSAESTGWLLETGRGQIQVDVSNISAIAEQLMGKQVRISGDIEMRDYAKRGRTGVLGAQTITEAPAATA
jgi:hypothetical protein